MPPVLGHRWIQLSLCLSVGLRGRPPRVLRIWEAGLGSEELGGREGAGVSSAFCQATDSGKRGPNFLGASCPYPLPPHPDTPPKTLLSCWVLSAIWAADYSRESLCSKPRSLTFVV